MKSVLLVAGAGVLSAQAPVVPTEFKKVRQTNVVVPDPHLNPVRIVSWNIDRGERLNTIGSELERNPADLCLLQEVDWNTTRAGNVEEGAETRQAAASECVIRH